MATYFHGNTELHSGGGDGLQTLILMNPSYIGFSDQTNQQQNQSPNTNNNGSSNNLVYLPHAPQHFVGIPLSTSSAQDQDAAGFVPRVQYNLYNLPIDAGPARVGQHASQGLSLSLSSQQAYSMPSRVAGASPPRADGVRGLSSSSGSGVSNNGVAAQNQVLLGSKYLKAAQELLDEVVNVGKSIKGLEPASNNSKAKGNGVGEPSAAAEAAGPGECNGGGRRGTELSTVEKQEIQMKKAKLVNMLDEVEQRYRQYHHQMHIVITWFEQAAGLGSAKTYTALALQTISKQFRCLKDAILAQIRAASKSLGEEDANEGKIEGSSRLKYVDNQIRQQRALQQLGMIQHNAWRPQRGLPERAVSVLRAWLFEHFLHPYPKDSDKIMLAKQTGLTRSQVSNWFINARVRLWKPMVEEMYTEEMKDQDKSGSEEENNNTTTNKTSKTEQKQDSSTSKSTAPHVVKSPGPENQNMNFMTNQENPISMSTSSTSPSGMRNVNPSCFNLIGSSDMESIAQGSPKKLRNNNTSDHNLLQSPNSITSMKFDYERSQGRDGFTLMGAPTNFIGGFGTTYPISDLGRFGAEALIQTPYSGNGVSLTLGLPHCENNLSIPAAHHHQSFMPNQGMRGVVHEIDGANDFSGMNANENAHSSNVYESMNIQDRKRFVAQLLPDFVT